ncbi:hypothetical protein CLU96_1883 [Chryseobacterium sp. 52]|uniref:hypothetical protein n=1 Tax=Chryseobacterium sp. 52 TaxID=2035213 RepID=UPI000C19A4D7|nr:hypothetical protein [Chryseobacterium sp. 52]PIF44887.1 hypothetical protein CLU96_1883 [Chryseobacterium sp. 52]
MDKRTKKRTNYNEGILNVLKDKYGYSLNYIRMSLRGDRVGIMPDKIIKEYKALDFASTKAIEETAETLKP